MLVQTANAIALRFQNIARNGTRSARRVRARRAAAAERLHLGLHPGRAEPAVGPAPRSTSTTTSTAWTWSGRASRVRPADSRSKFLQAFHDLLRLTDQFYREASDTHGDARSVPAPDRAQGPPHDSRGGCAQSVPRSAVDRAQRDARSAVAARAIRDARLPARPAGDAVPRSLDGRRRRHEASAGLDRHERPALQRSRASSASASCLSIRHVRWDAITDPVAAQDWALSWRPEVQGYIHAYRMATGVTLSDDVVEVNRPGSPRYAQPSVLLYSRLMDQRRSPGLPAGPTGRLAIPQRSRIPERS